VVQQVTDGADRRRLIRRIAARTLLTVGGIVTFLAVVLVVAAWTEDISIEGDIGYANAEVVSDSMARTLVRFYTPDGAEHVPQVGVLYPAGLTEGDVVEVEYRQDNPELVRVAGRDAMVTLLPVGLLVLAVWAVLIPSIWALRRTRRNA
jgi:cell division septal protein FtsQ